MSRVGKVARKGPRVDLGLDELSDDQVARVRWDAALLETMPTLCTGQADDLKIERPTVRIWLSRCGIADGMPFNGAVTIERVKNGRWVETEVYRGAHR